MNSWLEVCGCSASSLVYVATGSHRHCANRRIALTIAEALTRRNHAYSPPGFHPTLMSHIELVALVVREYQPAIDFFVNVLQFELVEDVPSLTNDGTCLGMGSVPVRCVIQSSGSHRECAPMLVSGWRAVSQ